MSTFVESICWQDLDARAVADDRELMTYGQLRESAEKIAGLLSARFGRGNYALLKARPDVRFVATMLGTMLSGNTPIPIDPQSPDESVRYMQDKSRAVAVLEPLEESEYRDCPTVWSPEPSMPALVMFTSGTSGYPKGALISHDNLLHACQTISGYLSYREHRSAAVVLPLYYSYALLSQVCCQLFVGGFVRLFANLRNPIKVARTITELDLETFCGVPSTYHGLCSVHQLSALSFPTVRVICSAGAAMDRAPYADVKAMFPNSTLFNNYGMTEAAPRISYVREDDSRFFESTCGQPMEGVEVKVVDPQTHVELPDGEQGMLVMRGPNITSGYLNDEALTRQAFTSDGFLISGDIAYMDKGYIMICGRHDDIFNVSGEKVAPLEIERALNCVSGVARAAVCGVKDEQRGTVPVAFLQLSGNNGSLTRRQLQAELKDKLTMSKLPQRFFEIRSFPMTANGKLMRRRLAIDDPQHVIREIL